MAGSTPAARSAGATRGSPPREPAPAARSSLGVLGTALVAAAIALKPTVDDAIKEITLPLRHEDMIRQQARDKNLDPALIAAVIYRESKFRDADLGGGRQGPDADPARAPPSSSRTAAGGTEFEHARPREPADQHLLRELVPALPARPLRRQRGGGGRRLQRRATGASTTGAARA